MGIREDSRPRGPRLSVIICIFNMAREAPRTLLSASVPYQQDISEDGVEVIVVDNGSTEPLPTELTDDLPAGITLVRAPDPRPSPAMAMNWAAREVARGEILLFAIDGARILTDRLYATSLEVHDLVDDAFAFTLGWHLGHEEQMASVRAGYDEAVEDRLLAGSGWPGHPAGLFDISVFAGSSSEGFFRPIAESNAFSVPRSLLDRLGGYDERYSSPGGGLCNLELFRRYVTRPGARNVCLLSEGTFHQVHGGIATSGAKQWADFEAEHRAIFGESFELPTYSALYYGKVRREAERFLRASIEAARQGAT